MKCQTSVDAQDFRAWLAKHRPATAPQCLQLQVELTHALESEFRTNKGETCQYSPPVRRSAVKSTQQKGAAAYCAMLLFVLAVLLSVVSFTLQSYLKLLCAFAVALMASLLYSLCLPYLWLHVHRRWCGRSVRNAARNYVLVTGASSGMGREITLELMRSGVSVFAAVRSEAACAKVRKRSLVPQY